MAPAIAGDVFHNLRTALDHVAWQFVLLEGGTPNETTTFPLLEKSTDRDGTPRAPLVVKPGISDPTIMAAVEAMQPIAEAHYGTTRGPTRSAAWRTDAAGGS
jgi:hypothetical protein